MIYLNHHFQKGIDGWPPLNLYEASQSVCGRLFLELYTDLERLGAFLRDGFHLITG